MKPLNTSYLLLFLILFLALSCKKETSTPTSTTVVNNSPAQPDYYTSNQNSEYSEVTYKSYSNNLLKFSGSTSVTHTFYSQLNLIAKVTDTGTYSLGPAADTNNANFMCWAQSGPQVMDTTNLIRPGTLRILSLNATKRYITGTFYFKIPDNIYQDTIVSGGFGINY